MPEPSPTPAVVAQLGYTEVVKLGESYANQLGYTTPKIRQAEEISRGIWRVRFGVGESGSGRLLELELDARTRTLLKSTELVELQQSPVPAPAPRPSQ
jgi:hypothetical protein